MHVTYLCMANSTIRFLPGENSYQPGHLLSLSLSIACDQWVAKNQLMQCILTSTKNASLVITDFLAMVYKNEQPCTAYLSEVGRSWKLTLI